MPRTVAEPLLSRPIPSPTVWDIATPRRYSTPELGEFASLLSYWYWAITGAKHEDLRELTGSLLIARASQCRAVYSTGLAARLVRQVKASFSALPKPPYLLLNEAYYQTLQLDPEESWTNPRVYYQAAINQYRRR